MHVAHRASLMTIMNGSESKFKRILNTEDHFKPFWLVSIARLTTDYQSPLVVIKRVTEEKFSENLIDDVPNIS